MKSCLPRPFHNHLIVKEVNKNELTTEGLIVDIGKGTRCENIRGGWMPVDAGVGEKILFSKRPDLPRFSFNGQEFLILRESDILAKYPYNCETES